MRMKMEMATKPFKLVDESITETDEKIMQELLSWFREEVISISWAKDAGRVVVNRVDDQKCKYCEKRWPIKAKIRKHKSIKAFSIFRSSSLQSFSKSFKMHTQLVFKHELGKDFMKQK